MHCMHEALREPAWPHSFYTDEFVLLFEMASCTFRGYWTVAVSPFGFF